MKFSLPFAVALSATIATTVAVVFIVTSPVVAPVVTPPAPDVIVETPVPIEPEPSQSSALTANPTTELSSAPQFVLLAFDGSYSLDMWQQTRDFATQSAAAGAPVHFTYFINPAYLMTPSEALIDYAPPGHPAGSSAIGFAYSDREIAKRVTQINSAVSEGHEIGSHAVGHYDGNTWSAEDWLSELTQFQTIVDLVDPTLPHVQGFRAPELGVSDGLWPTLKTLGYRYDASTTGSGANAWPTKNADGLWLFPLPHIPYHGTGHQLLSMDYNFYYQQTQATDQLVKGTPEWQQAYDDTLQTYLDYFKTNHTGNHAPVYMANHFSLWNDGLYWEVMKSFASDVCGLPDVQCITHAALADYLDQRKI